jgi:hypothetical protein
MKHRNEYLTSSISSDEVFDESLVLFALARVLPKKEVPEHENHDVDKKPNGVYRKRTPLIGIHRNRDRRFNIAIQFGAANQELQTRIGNRTENAELGFADASCNISGFCSGEGEH